MMMTDNRKILASDLHFVVVVYNKSCDDSVTCNYLIGKKELGIDVIIVDNSTKELGNAEFSKKNGWKYISMNGNAGLSRAYNRALHELKGSSGYVVWADDDSAFDDKYIEEMLASINANRQKYSVFVPLVYAGDKIYSPDSFKKDGFIRQLGNISELDKNRISAINSGLVVDLEVYKKYKYDTKMFLDFIDHDFCLYCLKHNIRLKLTEKAIIRQNSFFSGKPSREALAKRRSIYEKDFMRYVRKNGLSVLKGYKKLYTGKIVQFLSSFKKV